MKILNLLLILLILASCDPSYKIKEDKISSSEKIGNGFKISEINVDKFNEEGRPIEYSEKTILACATITTLSVYLSKKYYSVDEKKTYEKNKKIMDSIMILNGNTIGGEGHSEGIDQWITSNNIIKELEEKYFPFKPMKDIYFKKSNPSYKWIFTRENGFYNYDLKVHDTLPINFKLEQWYLINFSNQSHLTNKLFFKKTKSGFEQYHYYNQPIFGV